MAEEIVQEAFIRFARSPGRKDEPAAYLRVIVVNLCRSQQRRTLVERRMPPKAPLLSGIPDIDETWELVRNLPFRQRAVLMLRYYEDLSEADIARLLNCRPGTVKSALHRGIAALRKQLGESRQPGSGGDAEQCLITTTSLKIDCGEPSDGWPTVCRGHWRDRVPFTRSPIPPVARRPDDDDGAFLDEEPCRAGSTTESSAVVLVAATVLLLAAVGLSVGFVVAGTGAPRSAPHQSSNTNVPAARARVISALGATTAAGNWNITYSYTQVPGETPATTTTVPPAVSCPTTDPAVGASGGGCAVLVVPGSSRAMRGRQRDGKRCHRRQSQGHGHRSRPQRFRAVIIRLDASQLWELGS